MATINRSLDTIVQNINESGSTYSPLFFPAFFQDRLKKQNYTFSTSQDYKFKRWELADSGARLEAQGDHNTELPRAITNQVSSFYYGYSMAEILDWKKSSGISQAELQDAINRLLGYVNVEYDGLFLNGDSAGNMGLIKNITPVSTPITSAKTEIDAIIANARGVNISLAMPEESPLLVFISGGLFKSYWDSQIYDTNFLIKQILPSWINVYTVDSTILTANEIIIVQPKEIDVFGGILPSIVESWDNVRSPNGIITEGLWVGYQSVSVNRRNDAAVKIITASA